MIKYYNQRFRNLNTESSYVDDYLADERSGKNDMMRSMGIDVWPRDENDIFVPTDKNSLSNIRMVSETLNEAYNLNDTL